MEPKILFVASEEAIKAKFVETGELVKNWFLDVPVQDLSPAAREVLYRFYPIGSSPLLTVRDVAAPPVTTIEWNNFFVMDIPFLQVQQRRENIRKEIERLKDYCANERMAGRYAPSTWYESQSSSSEYTGLLEWAELETVYAEAVRVHTVTKAKAEAYVDGQTAGRKEMLNRVKNIIENCEDTEESVADILKIEV